MAINLGSTLLIDGVEGTEDLDPMSSLANLVDVMLVFACGLLLALVVKYQVDITEYTEIDSSELSEVEDVEEVTDLSPDGGDGYVSMGTVWMDRSTGKYYMVTPEEE